MENVFKSSDRYAESKIELQELDPEDIESDFSEDEDDSPADKKHKRGRAAETPSLTAAEKLQEQRVETIKAINKRWACKDDKCNFGGECLVDKRGQHHSLTKYLKQRFARSIVDAGVGSVENPPSFLFDVEEKPRGLGGPRSSTTRTPPGKGKATADITILFSSPLTPSIHSPLTKTRKALEPSRGSSSTSAGLKRSLPLPLAQGSLFTLLNNDSAGALRMHQRTIENLTNAGFMRISQIARAYATNFEQFVSDAKLSSGLLADVEDLLRFWGESNGNVNSPGSLNFGPTGVDDFVDPPDLQPPVKMEPRSPLRSPLRIGRHEAIEVPDSSQEKVATPEKEN
ncbi:unnamed protein product [Tilletia controversa]|nr:unnamed protein product [Tilletia controversa]